MGIITLNGSLDQWPVYFNPHHPGVSLKCWKVSSRSFIESNDQIIFKSNHT